MRASEDYGIHILPPINLSGEIDNTFESTIFDRDDEEDFESYYDAIHQENDKIQAGMADSIEFIAKPKEGTVNYHQDTKQPEQKKFRETMIKEFNDNPEKKSYKVVLIKEIGISYLGV